VRAAGVEGAEFPTSDVFASYAGIAPIGSRRAWRPDLEGFARTASEGPRDRGRPPPPGAL